MKHVHVFSKTKNLSFQRVKLDTLNVNLSNHAQSSVEIPISVNTFPSCGVNLNLVMVAFNDTHREKFNSAQECNKVNSWQLLIAINQCFTQSIKVL